MRCWTVTNIAETEEQILIKYQNSINYIKNLRCNESVEEGECRGYIKAIEDILRLKPSDGSENKLAKLADELRIYY